MACAAVALAMRLAPVLVSAWIGACGAASAPGSSSAERGPAATPESVSEAAPAAAEEEEVEEEPVGPVEDPDCFAAACDRAYAICFEGDDPDLDCETPYAACRATACAEVEPPRPIEPVAVSDLLFSIAPPTPARAVCPPESVELSCESERCATSSDGRHEACVVVIQGEDEGRTYALMVRDGRRWARVIDVVGRAVEPASLTFSFVEVQVIRWIEGPGGPWLELRWERSFTDADWCSGANGSQTLVAVCGPRRGRTTCVGAFRTSAEEHEGGGRIDLVEDASEAELDACMDEAGRRARHLVAWTAAQPRFDVTLGADGSLVWTDRPLLLDGLATLEDLAARTAGLRVNGEW